MLQRLAIALGCGVAVACSAPPGDAAQIGSSSSQITTTDALSRAAEWVDAKLLYCQSANHQPDDDTSCSPVCTREDNAEWDPYRSDCSGFVSWAWGLPAPGRVTSEFAPADTTVSHVIQGTDLEPGDAVNDPADHIILFVKWITQDTEAEFYEEPGCSSSTPYAHSFTSSVTITGSSVYVSYEGKAFTSIRYDAITAPTPPPTADAGTCCGNAVVPPHVSVDTTNDGGAPPTSTDQNGGGGCNVAGSADPRGVWMFALAILALARRRK